MLQRAIRLISTNWDSQFESTNERRQFGIQGFYEVNLEGSQIWVENQENFRTQNSGRKRSRNQKRI